MLVTSGGQFPSFHFLIILFIIVTTVRSGSARITSTFTRSEWPSTDIPLDNEAFAIPKGHNAPQQVSSIFCNCFVPSQNTHAHRHKLDYKIPQPKKKKGQKTANIFTNDSTSILPLLHRKSDK